jgi:hypothetical protein
LKAKTLLDNLDQNGKISQALVAYAYNPNYSGGRDQENAVQSQSEKNPSPKRTGGVTQSVDLEFKSQYCKKCTIMTHNIIHYE